MLQHIFPSLTLLSHSHAAPSPIYTLSLHDALPIFPGNLFYVAGGDIYELTRSGGSRTLTITTTTSMPNVSPDGRQMIYIRWSRSEEHTSELQSLRHLVCRLLLEKKNPTAYAPRTSP